MAALPLSHSHRHCGLGDTRQELGTCTQLNSTNETQNCTVDSEAGEVRTKLLEKISSQDKKHISAARKEGCPVLPSSPSWESQACCHQAFLRMLPLKTTQNNDEQVSKADGSLLHNSILMTREILNMTGLFCATRDLY